VVVAGCSVVVAGCSVVVDGSGPVGSEPSTARTPEASLLAAEPTHGAA
jgi:hypothetical protein